MRRTVRTALEFALVVGVIPNLPLGAQSAPAPKLEFEVATVRQNKAEPDAPRAPGDAQGSALVGGQFAMRNQPLRTLLGFAFYPGNQKFRNDIIVGAPAAAGHRDRSHGKASGPELIWSDVSAPL